MRIVELVNKVRVPVTNEEAEVLSLFDDIGEVHKMDLTPRQQLLANYLVNKDVLYRINENGRIIYKKKT
jgi:hypothetical protein